MKIMLGILASAALVALVGTGLYLRFGLQVLDRPGMENPAGPMLELLSAQWTSEDGVWSARIEGETLDLSYRQNLVYSGSFSFDFQGDDLNVKTELTFDDKQFESEDGSVSGTIESLYVENCRLYLALTISKEGEGSMRQQAVLDRVEYVEPAESELGEIREVSEMAELMEFSWNQITIGDIMLLIPGLAMTNSIRDVLVGDTISGVMRLIESLLCAGALACGFMSAIWLIGG